MPTYEYICSCVPGIRVLRVKPVARYQEGESCPNCDREMVRVISPAIIRGDIQPYNCPVTGRLISSRKQHEENLLRTDCRVLERGEKEDSERKRAAADEAYLDQMADTAAQLVLEMPQEKKERLVRELTTTSTVIERS